MYIDINSSIQEVSGFLTDLGFLAPEEKIKDIEKPGEGNMNVVLRIETNKRSFIVKQSRPFVQKYQEISAPLDRIDVEHQFYSSIVHSTITRHTPKVLGYFKEQATLILEDLGRCDDMSFIYKKRVILDSQLDTLVSVLCTIHSATITGVYPKNKDLRLLNHQHIFILPFLSNNGFSLDQVQEGLEQLSTSYKNDEALKKEIAKVGAYYLENGNTLLHGDYYPGSWITKKNHVYIIDPEFSFKGFAEFDLGVLIAHVVMATMDTTMVTQVKERYTLSIKEKLLSQIIGIEIMRRLIGLAQLPLNHSLKEKSVLMKFAYSMILE